MECGSWQDITIPTYSFGQFTEGTPEQQDNVIYILLSLKGFRFAFVSASWGGNTTGKGL